MSRPRGVAFGVGEGVALTTFGAGVFVRVTGAGAGTILRGWFDTAAFLGLGVTDSITTVVPSLLDDPPAVKPWADFEIPLQM